MGAKCYHFFRKFSIFSKFLPESRLKILSRRYTTPLSISPETAGDADPRSSTVLVDAVHLFPVEPSVLWLGSNTWRVRGEEVTAAAGVCDQVGTPCLTSDCHEPLREHIVYHTLQYVNYPLKHSNTFIRHNKLCIVYNLQHTFKYVNILNKETENSGAGSKIQYNTIFVYCIVVRPLRQVTWNTWTRNTIVGLPNNGNEGIEERILN